MVPIFPLPGLYLLPGTVIPLHVFEDRYRRMVDDLLDGPGRLVLGTVLPGHEQDLAGSPPVRPVAGLGEIGRHEKLEDGRFLILVIGLQRVHVREVPSDRPYRLAEIQPLEEIPVQPGESDALHAELVEAVRARVQAAPVQTPLEPKDIPFEKLGHSRLADLLLMHLDLEEERRFALFAERDVERRAERCLEEHRRQRES